jgi:hypothetical protein
MRGSNRPAIATGSAPALDNAATSNIGPSAFWSVSAAEMFRQLGSAEAGLSTEDARQRLTRYGLNVLKPW